MGERAFIVFAEPLRCYPSKDERGNEMRRLTAFTAAAVLALTACTEPTQGPAERPTHEASGR